MAVAVAVAAAGEANGRRNRANNAENDSCCGNTVDDDSDVSTVGSRPLGAVADIADIATGGAPSVAILA